MSKKKVESPKNNYNNSKTERFLPDITSYHDLEENSSTHSFEKKEESGKEIINLEISNLGNQSNLHNQKYFPLDNMSISTIKHFNISNPLNNLSETNQNNLTLNKFKSIENLLLSMIPEENETEEKRMSIQKVIYKKEEPNNYFISKHRNYCIIQCRITTTYFVDNVVFSKFTTPKDREMDPLLTCSIMDKKNFNFEYNDGLINQLKLNDNLKKTEVDKKQFQNFISGINKMFQNQDFLNILDEFRRKKFINFFICVILILIIFGLIILGFFLLIPDNDNEGREVSSLFWIEVIALIIIISILIVIFIRTLFYALIVIDQIKTYEILKYHIKEYNNLENYFSEWNLNLFIPNAIYVSCPPNIDYIIFNLNPFKEIEIEHHVIGKE